jgi:hypothetical protein
MTDWPDDKIYNNAIWDIRRRSMDSESWRFTRLQDHFSCVSTSLDGESGERVIVSAKTLSGNWYAMTTRRLVGMYCGRAFDVLAKEMTDCTFGDNPKGHGNVPTDVATIIVRGASSASFEFETGKAWMAPEHCITWWIRKYPILDSLRFDPAVS